MANDGFDDIWVPRIGSQAAVLLRRNGYLTLVVGPVVFGIAIACSFAFGSGSPVGLALGCLGVMVAITLCTIWLRSRMQFAAAISQWFGTKVGWQEMPKMRPDPFDAWCRQRNLHHGLPDERM